MDKRPWLSSYPKGLKAEIDVHSLRTLTSSIENSLGDNRNRIAISSSGEQMTFEDLDGFSRAFAAYAQSSGLRRGDRLAILMPNGLPYPVAVVAALRAGLIVVTINPLYTPREIDHQLADAGVKCVMCLDEHVATLLALKSATIEQIVVARGSLFEEASVTARRERVGNGDVSVIDLRDAISAGRGKTFESIPARLSDVALLQYTGGTTGTSKGAMLTHGSVAASLEQTRSWLRLVIERKDMVLVTPLPIYHVFPLAMTLLCLMEGAENRLIPNPRDTPAVIRELQRAPFDFLIGVNTLFSSLVANPGLREVDFSRTRLVMGAGASVQGPVAARWKAAGGPDITEGYGLTEASPGVTFNPPGKNGTIGLPAPSTEVTIVGPNDVPVSAGTAGELLIKGPQIFAGYWQRPEETARAFTRDGWLRTGDIVSMDAQGFLHLADRKKDMISVSGFNVYPNEIEAVVKGLPEVEECACVGVPDERSGEAPHLFVVTDSLTVDAIRIHCRENLAAYKVPKHISLVASLPKSAVGKILRRELRDSLSTSSPHS